MGPLKAPTLLLFRPFGGIVEIWTFLKTLLLALGWVWVIVWWQCRDSSTHGDLCSGCRAHVVRTMSPPKAQKTPLPAPKNASSQQLVVSLQDALPRAIEFSTRMACGPICLFSVPSPSSGVTWNMCARLQDLCCSVAMLIPRTLVPLAITHSPQGGGEWGWLPPLYILGLALWALR